MRDRTYGLLKEARARWRDFDDASRKDPGMYERFRRNNRETSKKYSKFFLEQNDRIMAGKRAVAGDFEAAKKQKAVERLGIKLNLSPRAERIYRKSLNGLSPRELDNIRTINNANFEQAAKESDFRKAETERLKNFVNAGKKENVSAIEGEVSKVQEAAKKGFRPARKQLALAGGIAAGTAALGGAAYAGKKLYDRHKSKAEEQAEKAAAYYDEAQYAKEAAIDDYNEACAYEEAALTILDELGYLD